MDKCIQKILIRAKSIDDLDWELQNEFKIDESIYSRTTIIEEDGCDVDSYIINIDTMIGELQKLKEDGATHMAISYHDDHIGYDFAGFLVRESTDEEINDYIAKMEAKREIDRRRAEILKQLKDINDLPF
jgi:hypothetical protein